MYTDSDTKLLKACQILFGPGVDVSRDFLFYIQPSGIKSAYRKRALVTHPDRLLHLGEDARQRVADRFIETTWAYRKLLEFINRRDRGARLYVTATNRTRPKMRPMHAEPHGGSRRPHGNYYRGPMPFRRLPIGQFLFYAGEISWESLIKAIVWQRNQRPRMGDIAKKWGWLREPEILFALKRRRLGEPIGEALVRHELLSRAQLEVLLRTQRNLQKPFGDYFVLNGHLTRNQLNGLLRELARHNANTRGGRGNSAQRMRQ